MSDVYVFRWTEQEWRVVELGLNQMSTADGPSQAFIRNRLYEQVKSARPEHPERQKERDALFVPRPLDEYHEDMGDVLWWSFPIEEPPYVGSPLDLDWPGYHTHFTPLPSANEIQHNLEGK